MNIGQTFDSAFYRVNSGMHKLRWGMGVVGAGATARGVLRFIGLRLRRPEHAEITLGSGSIIGFDYPSQFPTILVMFGDLIDPEFAFLNKVMKPDAMVADIGAAIGQFTLFAARWPGVKIHAFEPSSSNVATLQRNIERNRVSDRVQIHQLALSYSDGEASFETAPKTWMSQLSAVSSAGAETEIVQVRTLTGELARLGVDHLDVLKLNVAGFEPQVMEGAMPFLAEGRADILILLLGLDSLPWYEKIAALGYRFFYYHAGERTLYEVTAFDEASVLDHRPTPARHILAIHENAVPDSLAAGIAIKKL